MDTLTSFFSGLLDALLKLLLDVVNLGYDTFLLLFDSLYGLVGGLFTAVSLALPTINGAAILNAVPQIVWQAWGALEIGPALAIIVAAISFRFARSWIPFIGGG